MSATLTTKQVKEFFEELEQGHITLGQLRRFAERCRQKDLDQEVVNRILESPLFPCLMEAAKAGTLGDVGLISSKPDSFERNEHGHIVLTFIGLDPTGRQEFERLTTAGFRIRAWAKSCLLSTNEDSYDKNHRLVAGRQYKVALMPTREIERDSDRTTDALRTRGLERYGYEKPLAGIVPRIRETVSDKQMEEMGFNYISAPHDPIKDSDGGPVVLNACRDGGGQWLDADWDLPVNFWLDSGAFAFLVSAS